MTGIIYDGKTIAADQLSSRREYTIYGYTKKLEEWNRGIVATAGTASDGVAFKDWLNTDMQAKPPSLEKSFEGLYTDGNDVFIIWNDLIPMKAKIPTGIGSAGEILETLVHGGMSAEKALKTAMKFRTDIGGKIDVYKLNGE